MTYVPDSEDTTHSSTRGEEMTTSTSMSAAGEHDHVHCCDCWRYTDDSRRQAELTRDATTVLCNAQTLAVEKSEAFTAADKYLSAVFAANMPSKMPRF
jgi:hypothetical protein